MTDQELDRALAGAFAVEPQADFLARVRVRVSTEPEPLMPIGWWRGAVVGAAVVALAVSGAFWVGVNEPPAARPRDTLVSRSLTPAVGMLPIQPRRAEAEVRVLPRTSSQPRVLVMPGVAVGSFPVPTISREDAGAIRLLAASARSGIVSDLLSGAGDPDAPLEVSSLEVPSLGTEPPIELSRIELGERQ